MKTKISLLLTIISFTATFAQTPDFSDTQIVNGFEKKISGEDFSYHSSIPPAKECLLIRATDGNSVLEWETSPAPEKIEHEFVTFVWLAGLGSSPGRARFDLQVNGADKFSFWADGSNSWEIKLMMVLPFISKRYD
jgi:alpha-mannosidase